MRHGETPFTGIDPDDPWLANVSAPLVRCGCSDIGDGSCRDPHPDDPEICMFHEHVGEAPECNAVGSKHRTDWCPVHGWKRTR